MRILMYLLIAMFLVSCNKKTITVVEPQRYKIVNSKPDKIKEKTEYWPQENEKKIINAVEVKEVIHFDFDSEKIRSKEVYKLDGIVASLEGEPWVVLALDGHACEIGTDDYNYDLGLRRAGEVEKYLSQSLKIKTIVTSYGEKRPVSDNKELNRRVEIYTIK